MSRYDHKIETSLEGIEHLSKEKSGCSSQFSKNKESEGNSQTGHRM